MTESTAKKKFPKPLKIVLIILLAAAIVTGVVFAGLAIARAVDIKAIDDLALAGQYDNIVLLIGDGMGFDHIAAGRAYLGVQELFMESAATVRGDVTTFSRTVVGPTDSAAAATALATGEKTDNGVVGQYLGKDLKNNTEYAMEQGMATGVIASEGVKGATPAGFSAHVASRSDEDGILEDQLASGIDLFLGGAKDYYDDHAPEIASAGYAYATRVSDLDPQADKVWGAFSELSTDEAGSDDTPTLAELAEFGMRYLDAASGGEGFFLMIEESHIDKCSHNGDIKGMLEHLTAYDRTIERVLAVAEELPGSTLVIATADHETGGLEYSGESADMLSDDMFTTGSHTTDNVPYFVYSEVEGLPETIDNTQIATVIRGYILRRQTARAAA